MGQAKRRGTYEQRRSAAVARVQAERIRRQEEADREWDRAHPPKVNVGVIGSSRRHSPLAVAVLLGGAMGLCR